MKAPKKWSREISDFDSIICDRIYKFSQIFFFLAFFDSNVKLQNEYLQRSNSESTCK